MANNPAERREGPPRASGEAGHSEMQTVGAVAPDITTQALSRDVVVPMVRISLVTSLQSEPTFPMLTRTHFYSSTGKMRKNPLECKQRTS